MKSPLDDFRSSHPFLQPGEDAMREEHDIECDEKAAMKYVRGLKEFWNHLLMFVIFASMFLFLGKVGDTTFIWLMIGWAICVVLHGLVAYEVINIFNSKWERKQMEKWLGRRL